MKTEVKKLPKSEIEVEFELTEEEFKKHIDRALLHLKSHVKLDGFRQGQVPLDIVEKKVGQENLLMEAGDLAVKESYTRYVNENNLEPISQPEVQIKKIARGSEFLFTVKVLVLPEIELPDYKKIVSQIKAREIVVDEKEINDALNYLQKSRANFLQVDRGAEPKDFIEIEYANENINGGKIVKDSFILGEGGFVKDFEENIIGMSAAQKKEFLSKFPENHPDKKLAGKESKFWVKVMSVKKVQLPKINDEFAKSLGAFNDLPSLRASLKEGIAMEKQEAEKQRKRDEILSKISEKIQCSFPEKMVEYEKEKLLVALKNQIAQNLKLPFEEYLKIIKKTAEEIKNNFQLEAERKIKNYLILRQIGKVENIEASNLEIEEEMNKVIKNYTKEEAGKIDIGQLKEYTKEAIINEKIFQLMEGLSEIKN